MRVRGSSTKGGAIRNRARAVRLAVFDVDGVLTDGTLYIGASGEAFKAFNILDGHGVKMLQSAGIATAILSGRESEAVRRRAAELGIATVIEAAGDKLGLDPEKVVLNIDRLGNTAAASIPIGLAEAAEDGRLRRGDLVLLSSVGAGMTWGSALIRW